LLKEYISQKTLLSDISSNKKYSLYTYIVLAAVSCVMTVMNVITHKGTLTVCTGVFTVLCGLNILLVLVGPLTEAIAKVFFAIEVLLMFSFFLISGNPDGFSAIWICMLPSIGMFFFNRTRGSVLCVCMFAILVTVLWTPVGDLVLFYDYNPTFKMRFPVLFVAFHILAFILETLRLNAYKETERLQKHYRELSIHDTLTKLYNRQGLYSTLEENEDYVNAEKIGAIIFDIDNFKHINDTFGHKAGDKVLIAFSELLESSLNGVVCRWGGEEFVGVYKNGDVKVADIENALAQFKLMVFTAHGAEFSVTASAGVCEKENYDIEKVDLLISKADKALYIAKSTGKDKVVLFELSS